MSIQYSCRWEFIFTKSFFQLSIYPRYVLFSFGKGGILMKNLMQRINFIFTNRFIILGIYLIFTAIIQFLFWGNILPGTDINDLWFYSGSFMVLFSILFIEPYYSSPKNVVTNITPLILVLIASKTSFVNQTYWWIGFIYSLVVLFISIAAMAFESPNMSNSSKPNIVSAIMKNIATIFGTGKVLYSIVFLFFLLTYYKDQQSYVLVQIILWLAIMFIDPKKLHNKFSLITESKKGNQIGEIIGVQSNKIFLAMLFDDSPMVAKHSLVYFLSPMANQGGEIVYGLVIDSYLLNKERWLKILQLTIPQENQEKLEKSIIYLVEPSLDTAKLKDKLKIDSFVGVVIENSSIDKVRFEYSKVNDDLAEGDLLELRINDRRIFYQVANGNTRIETLETKNETGLIEGEALQLGEWDNLGLCFQRYGWVPPINTPLFIADTSDITIDDCEYPLCKLGTIPGTNLPLIVDLDDAISHHLALIGVTGSGKSHLANEIINKIKVDTKIICIDFNKEFVVSLKPAPKSIIGVENAERISNHIDWIVNEKDKFPNQQNHAELTHKEKQINEMICSDIHKFLDQKENNICVFELPDVINTTAIFEYTKYFFKVLFSVAKQYQQEEEKAKLCVVLEEAHTIIPEWNFSGSSDKNSQGLVNSIGQIALQGRKYGIGFLVITQRTATVSKTVLTQCNTVVSFQVFDETSLNFLNNYLGKNLISSLPNLRKYHAVIAGKASKSNIPMIVDLTDNNKKN